VHPQTLCKHKLLFWMRLIAINRLTALIYLLSCVCVIENLIYNFILYHSILFFNKESNELRTCETIHISVV